MHPFLRLLVLALFACAIATGQTISPFLVGNNLWYASRSAPSTTPSAEVMSLASAAGIRLVRIGGKEFDKNPPSNSALLTWVDRIRASGAEPVVQVSQYASASAAASAVTHLNIVNGRAVRYWSIGNEPWLQANQDADAAGATRPTEAQIAAAIETYFKARAAAMKAADPSIRIFGVDSEDFQDGLHSRLFGGSNNIAGVVPGQTYHYCDGISWHRYPQQDGIDPAYQGLADIRSRIESCAARVAAANAALGRSGENALVWSVGEFNSKNGAAVHTWGNGQMFAGVYGLAMKHGAQFAAAWSLRESDGARTSTDFGLLDGDNLVPRPSYWHAQLVARHFTGRYLEGSPSVSDASSALLVYGAEDAALDRVSVMIVNRGSTARPYTLHLNSAATFAESGGAVLKVDAGRSDFHADTIPARCTHVLVFRRDSLTRVAYGESDFTAVPARGPGAAVLPRRLSAPVDDFAAYTDIAQAGYWTPLHLGGGAASVADGRLVLRAGNAAYSTAALTGPVSADYNFFRKGFTLSLSGFSQSASGADAASTHFRISLNSSALRPFRAADSLALRVTPEEIRLGWKVDQPDVQPELRSGAASAEAFLERVATPGAIREMHLTLEPDPPDPVSGLSLIRYRLRVDGSLGRALRAGSFIASAIAWGGAGDSALCLEARRENPAAGPTGAFVEARIDTVSRQARLLDDFSAYSALDEQTWWKTANSGAQSTAGVAAGSAVLLARADAFAAAALAGPVSADLNFFDRAFTLELRDLALTPANLGADQAVFRLSLGSTSERSFASPDALALRLNPDRVRLGFKIDQPSTDAETRSGPAGSAPLVDDALPGPATGVLLTLAPVSTSGATTTVFYALKIDGAFGSRAYAGSFQSERAQWGAAGDSALVLEARRNASTAGAASSYQLATIGAIALGTAPDDLFSEAPRLASWRLREFGAEELSAAAVSGPSAAPAGDGVPNLLKYALGLPARTPATPALLPSPVTLPDGGLALAHSERAGSELLYDVEASADLATWTAPVIEIERAAPDAAGWIDVVTRASSPAGAQRVFLRLRVTTP